MALSVAQLLPIAINLLAQTSLKFISYSLVLIIFFEKNVAFKWYN